MSTIDNKNSPINDIWSHFADFLAELIARHAEELDIDSWPDPQKVLKMQELENLYRRFIQLSLQARNGSNPHIPLEVRTDVWYSPYIQTSDFEEIAL